MEGSLSSLLEHIKNMKLMFHRVWRKYRTAKQVARYGRRSCFAPLR
jgi:hypothetical protein